MSRFIEGQSRTQSTMFPEVLDDYIHEENPIRAIDMFINSLKLSELGFARYRPAKTGRPSYSPATMLKIYLYGYLNRIHSSRRLEKETQRNVELMWLVERLTPDFKTIADFRKDNSGAIQQVCKQFVLICRELNMFTDAIVAVDGTKFKACNNIAKNYSRGLIKSCIETTEKDIANYLMELDRADRQSRTADTEKLKGKLEKLQSRLESEKALQQELETIPDKQLSYTDPDSRRMALKHKGVLVGYNVQAAVDTKHHLILAHYVTNNPTDRHQLVPISQHVQQALDKRDITVLADRGYYDNASFKVAHEAGITAIVPKTHTSGNRRKGLFTKEDFIYNKEKDVYECPAGKDIPFSFVSTDRGKPVRGYLSVMTCKDCSMKSRCTTSSAGRRIRRLEDERHAERVAEAYKSMPNAMTLRHQTVEHPFGTIKQWAGTHQLLTRTLKNVKTEVSLHILAYNFKRMINIMGVNGLMSALKT
jgi:transposase